MFYANAEAGREIHSFRQIPLEIEAVRFISREICRKKKPPHKEAFRKSKSVIHHPAEKGEAENDQHQHEHPHADGHENKRGEQVQAVVMEQFT